MPLGAATVPTMSAAYPGASVFLPVAQSVAVGPIGSSVPVAYYPVGPVYPPGSTVLVDGAFDAGARFGAGGTASIPVSTNVPWKPRLSPGIPWVVRKNGSFYPSCRPGGERAPGFTLRAVFSARLVALEPRGLAGGPG